MVLMMGTSFANERYGHTSPDHYKGDSVTFSEEYAPVPEYGYNEHHEVPEMDANGRGDLPMPSDPFTKNGPMGYPSVGVGLNPKNMPQF